jgi:hypothetical protein
MKILYDYFVSKELKKKFAKVANILYMFGVLCKLEYNGKKSKV